MATFNPDFWEVSAPSAFLESVPSESALWFETAEDQERRYALQDFFQSVLPVVSDIIDEALTDRQREVVTLYYFHGKSQEDIASILDLSQSTVSRHLFGTVRDGKKVGGAITKLKKVIEKTDSEEISAALDILKTRWAERS